MPVQQLRTTLSSCVAASLMLTACSSPKAPEEGNGAVTEIPNAAQPAEPSPTNIAAPDEPIAAATNASAPTTPEATAVTQPKSTIEPKAPTPVPAPSPVPVAKVERPAQFATCLTCHSVDRDGPNKIGPNLFGVVGSKAGSKPNYAYSDAMKDSGIVWTSAELDAFLLAPQTKIPRTKMTMKGPSDEKIRQSIIDYLATLK